VVNTAIILPTTIIRNCIVIRDQDHHCGI